MLLVLGGTSDTHRYLESIPAGTPFIVTVATEYGADLFGRRYGASAKHIRFTPSTLESFIADHGITCIVDTTHPFAREITATAVQVSCALGIPYENRMRAEAEIPDGEDITCFASFQDAAAFLASSSYKSIFFTIGGNSIRTFHQVADRATARVLPADASIQACLDAGIPAERIIAQQGPFSLEENIGQLTKAGADCLVTKGSGKAGGVDEKIAACRMLGIPAVVILPA